MLKNKFFKEKDFINFKIVRRKLKYLKKIKDKEMKKRENDNFSKSNIENPRKWWKKASYL